MTGCPHLALNRFSGDSFPRRKMCQDRATLLCLVPHYGRAATARILTLSASLFSLMGRPMPWSVLCLLASTASMARNCCGRLCNFVLGAGSVHPLMFTG